MRIDLAVPYEEKDQARALGARWDRARRIWYVSNADDLAPFMRWIAHDHLRFPTKDRKRKTATDTARDLASLLTEPTK